VAASVLIDAWRHVFSSMQDSGLRALVMASDGHLGMEDLTGAETDGR
jgi:hypothetical protein